MFVKKVKKKRKKIHVLPLKAFFFNLCFRFLFLDNKSRIMFVDAVKLIRPNNYIICTMMFLLFRFLFSPIQINTLFASVNRHSWPLMASLSALFEKILSLFFCWKIPRVVKFAGGNSINLHKSSLSAFCWKLVSYYERHSSNLNFR